MPRACSPTSIASRDNLATVRLPNAIGLNQPRFRADDVFRADPRGRQDALAAVSRLPEPQQHPLRGWLNATAPKKSR